MYRNALRLTAVILLTFVSGFRTAPAVAATSNPIVIENARTGTTQWKLLNPALQHEIEGYASATSVNRGQSINLYVNTAAPTFDVDVFRMGYYGGLGARLMYSATSIGGGAQPTPCVNPAGVIECNWSVTHTLAIPAVDDPTQPAYWTSGVYLARITANNTAKKDSYILFVVRDDSRAASFVAQLPVTTYQAYNYWGGKSLYTGCVNHTSTWACANGQQPATAVSFNRPYTPSTNPAAAYGAGAGEFLTNVQPVQEGYPISSAGFDYNMVRWLEKEGRDVKYVTNLDLHQDQNVMHDASAFISFGHDEYYSASMWNNLVAARNAGINLAFFSSNEIYWRVRFQAGAYGRANGIMVCYKYVADPVTSGDQRTGRFRNLGLPEASLIGSQYVADPVTADITVTNSSHWLFDGSGATGSTVLTGLLGYEVNAIDADASPANVVALAHSVGSGYTSDVSFYVAPSSAQVFSTGSMAWAWGLDDYYANGLRQNYASPVVQKVSANVLDALSEAGLETLINGASTLYLSKAEGTDAGQVMQSSAPTGLSKANQWRLIASGSGTFRIVSRATGLCLDAYGTQPGAVAGVRECNGGDNQEWLLTTHGNGYVAINDKRAGLCVTAAGTQPGLTLAACTQDPNQLWWRSSAGSAPPVQPPVSDIKPNVPITLSDESDTAVLSLDGPQPAALALTPSPDRPDYSQWRPTATANANYFPVVSLTNGLCLDAYGTSTGAIVGSWACGDNQPNQSWKFVPLGNSVYTLSDQRSGLCATRNANNGVQLAPCQALVSQRWLKTEPVIAPPTIVTLANAANGYFLGVAAGTTGSTIVTQAPLSDGFVIGWKLGTLDDGTVSLATTTNGYCLDAYGTTDGASVGTWDCHFEDNQRWRLQDASGGKVSLSDKRSGKCVGNGGSSSPGAPLVLEACNGNAGQLWTKQVQ
jgi:hypothetical protein